MGLCWSSNTVAGKGLHTLYLPKPEDEPLPTSALWLATGWYWIVPVAAPNAAGCCGQTHAPAVCEPTGRRARRAAALSRWAASLAAVPTAAMKGSAGSEALKEK